MLGARVLLSAYIKQIVNALQIGQDIDGEATNDRSGTSISMNAAGDRVAIGAYANDGGGTSSGSTRIYSLVGSTWTKLGQDIDGEAAGDLCGYSVSMNAAGDRVAIGSYDTEGSTKIGFVRIYSLVGSTWTKLGQDINEGTVGKLFGYSVSMNAAGSRVAIGVPCDDANGLNAGSVRIYRLVGSTWTKLGQDINDGTIGDVFGRSVSMNAAGDRVTIGAIRTGSDKGSVRIYSLVGSTWTMLGQVIDAASNDLLFGISVSMNDAGDRIAAGSHYSSGDSKPTSGSVKIYSLVGSTWTKLGQSINGEAVGDFSGNSVSMNAAGDRVAIGAPRNDGNGVDSGSTRIYSLVDLTWTKLVQDIDGETAGDFSGNSVSMNAAGDRVAIGAPTNGGNGSNSGSTRIYSI